MKVRNSLRSAKTRDKDCRVVRRKGRVYVINKKIRASRHGRAKRVIPRSSFYRHNKKPQDNPAVFYCDALQI